jgi:hypothetical protein
LDSGDGWARASRFAAICDTDLRGVGIETDVDRRPWPGMKRGWNEVLHGKKWRRNLPDQASQIGLQV